MTVEVRELFLTAMGWKAVVDAERVGSLAPAMRWDIIAVGGLLLLNGCSDACSNTLVSSLQAPDGLHTAVMFQRDCGATSGFSTQVSVLTPDEEPSGSGNTFVADDDHGAAAVGDWGGPWAEIMWIAGDHLLVRYAANSRIFEQNGQVSGVKISYAQADR